MTRPPAWRRYLRFWGPDRGADIEEELSFHLESRVRDLVRLGLPPAEARERARHEFGDYGRIRGELDGIAQRRARRGRRARLLEGMGQDLRLALRSLRRQPTLVAAVLLTLAVGIGASSTIFSVFEAALLRPLPYEDPERLVVLWEHNIPRDRPTNVVSPANFLDWRERAGSFDALGALVPSSTTLTLSDRAERVYGAQASPSVFEMLGVAAAVGRPLLGADAAGGQEAQVVVLSHGLWSRAFAGDAAVVGRSVHLGDESRTVVGVMPEGFQAPTAGWIGAQEFWTPLVLTEAERSPGRWLVVLARMRGGVALEGAREEMRTIAADLAEENPYDEGWSVNLVPLHEELLGRSGRVGIPVLAAAVGVLLLLACANVANLLLGRSVRRRREFAVQAALGGGRLRLARRVLVEALVLSAGGGALGLALAWWGTRGMRGLLPSELPGLEGVALSWPVLLFAAAATVLAAVLFGTLPAVAASGQAPALALRSDARAGGGAARPAGALVVAEVGLAVLLAVGAGLSLRSLAALHAVDPGFDIGGVATARVALGGVGELSFGDEFLEPEFNTLERLMARVDALPGVERVGLVDQRPLGGIWVATTVHRPGEEPEPGQEDVVADLRVASDDYFSAMGIRLLAGRTFGSEDHADAPPRGIVNASMARLLWGGRTPVGGRVVVHLGEELEVEVVGVAEDVAMSAIDEPSRSQLYFSHRQRTPRVADLAIRMGEASDAVLPALRSAVREADPAVPVYRVATVRELVRAATSESRLLTLLLATFAATALLLAGVGVYGVLATDVAGRGHEIGIRMALGARPARVLGQVLWRGLGQALLGLALGIAAALVATRLMEGLLFGVTPRDPLTFGGVAAVLLVVSLAAAWVPARRATRVHPTDAMRAD